MCELVLVFETAFSVYVNEHWTGSRGHSSIHCLIMDPDNNTEESLFYHRVCYQCGGKVL